MVDTEVWASYHLLLKTTRGKKRASPYIHNLIHSNLGRQRQLTPLYQCRGMKTAVERPEYLGNAGSSMSIVNLGKMHNRRVVS